MSDMMNEITNEDLQTGLTFDSTDISFDTGNGVLDVVLNVGAKVALVTGGVILGNLICFGGKKGFEAVASKVEEAKAKKAEEKAAEEQKK